jgi:hypothetical protein
MEAAMRKLAIGMAAAAAVVVAAPAFAQVYFGGPDVSVRVGPPHPPPPPHWGGPRHREFYAMRGEDCRVTVVRRHRPDGSVVVRRIRACD